jgi:hypothetical protein
MTQKETEDVIAKVMRTDSLRAEIVDQVIIKSIFFIKTTHTHTHTHTHNTHKQASIDLLDLEPDQMLANGQRGFKSRLVSNIYMNRIKTGGGFIECPREDCGW